MPYIPPTPVGPFEHAVKRAGYDWFTTRDLAPGDRLNRHVHGSHNTHLIHRGQLTFFPEERHFRQTVTIDANSNNPNDREFHVRPRLWYSAVAGNDGATFTEAHTILSPTTARRIRPEWYGHDDSQQAQDQWFAQHRNASLARGVRFGPVNQNGLPFGENNHDSGDDYDSDGDY